MERKHEREIQRAEAQEIERKEIEKKFNYYKKDLMTPVCDALISGENPSVS